MTFVTLSVLRLKNLRNLFFKDLLWQHGHCPLCDPQTWQRGAFVMINLEQHASILRTDESIGVWIRNVDTLICWSNYTGVSASEKHQCISASAKHQCISGSTCRSRHDLQLTLPSHTPGLFDISQWKTVQIRLEAIWIWQHIWDNEWASKGKKRDHIVPALLHSHDLYIKTASLEWFGVLLILILGQSCLLHISDCSLFSC